MCEKEGIFSKIFDMFVWMSGFQKSLAHTDFSMFVDEWTGANESPAWQTDYAVTVSFATPLKFFKQSVFCHFLNLAKFVVIQS